MVLDRHTLVEHEGCQGCEQHRPRDPGCAVAAGEERVPLDAFMGRVPCFIKDWLRRFAERFLAQRPRTLLEPDDLLNDTFARLLADTATRRGGFAPNLGAFLGYLRSTAARCAIEAERKERGRMRCGNCRHFAPWTSRCLRHGHAHTHREMRAVQDPRALLPPCQAFEGKRGVLEIDAGIDASLKAAAESDPADSELLSRLLTCLEELAAREPRVALVLRARLVEGRSYEQMKSLGISIRTMKRDYAHGLDLLRARLTEFAPRMAPPPGEGHSQGHGRHPS
jgi:DNA-directed RNA polymerase specialized sigma24 family protein